MKLAFLSFYSGSVPRGVETFVDALASRLGKKHEITVFQNGPAKKNEFYQEIRISTNWRANQNQSALLKRFFLDSTNRQLFSFTKKVLSHFAINKPDLIIPTNGGWQTFLVGRFCRKHHIPWVFSGQTGLGWEERWNLLQRPDRYIALTNRNAQWAGQYYPAQKIEIIPNGVDLAHFSPRGNKLPVKLKKPIILCIAGPESYKRVDTTIEAVSKLENGSLLVIGGNQYTQKLGGRLLGQRFHQTQLPHEKIAQAYRSADVFTLASQSQEAFGIVYVEALATNLPIVATDDEQRREIIGKAGLFVKHPEESLTYAQTLKQALIHPWGNLPRNQAMRFDWDSIASQYDQLFQTLTIRS